MSGPEITVIACEELARCGAGGVPMAIGVQSEHGDAVAGDVRQRGAEAAVPRAGDRRHAGLLDRRDRARRRLRRRRHPHPAVRDGDEWVHQRQQALHHQRHPGRLDVRARPHLRRGRLPRHVADRRARPTSPGFSVSRKLDKLGQRSLRHRRAGLRRRPGAGDQHHRRRSVAASSSRCRSSSVERMFAAYGSPSARAGVRSSGPATTSSSARPSASR